MPLHKWNHRSYCFFVVPQLDTFLLLFRPFDLTVDPLYPFVKTVALVACDVVFG